MKKFKTNLKCGGCVANVKSNLDNIENSEGWKVDLESTEKVLTVDAKVKSSDVIEAFKKAGFIAEELI